MVKLTKEEYDAAHKRVTDVVGAEQVDATEVFARDVATAITRYLTSLIAVKVPSEGAHIKAAGIYAVFTDNLIKIISRDAVYHKENVGLYALQIMDRMRNQVVDFSCQEEERLKAELVKFMEKRNGSRV